MNKLLSSFPPSVARFLAYTRPFFLLCGALTYALGAGVAHYMGVTIDWGSYWLGQGCVILLQLSMHFLNEYFNLAPGRGNPGRGSLTQGRSEQGISRLTAIITAATTLTLGAILTVLLLRDGSLDGGGIIILTISFIIAFFYAVPPLRLVDHGYGELIVAILIANLISAFGCLLQSHELYRLVAMSTFPLTFLYLAMELSLSLPDYAEDLIHQRKTFMVKVGWQKGMILHNALLLGAYLLLMVAVVQGLPWNLAWPGLLAFPLSGFQLFQMYRINQGAPPLWILLTSTSMAIFIITAYCLTYAYWIG